MMFRADRLWGVSWASHLPPDFDNPKILCLFFVAVATMCWMGVCLPSLT